MIAYNPKAWFTFIFRFHKADTLRKLFPTILGIALYCCIVVFLEREIIKLETSKVNNIGIVHTILGFVISMLLVFRTNTAYERWWDGRKLWGQLVNCTRNMAIKAAAYLPLDERERFKIIAVSFPYALKNHLRNHPGKNEDDLRELFKTTEINKDQHIPLQISGLMYKKINQVSINKQINSDQTLILNLEMQQWMEICGACERIKNTPIPFSYSVFIKKFIFFYVMTLPFSMVFSLGYYCAPVVVFIFYVLASMELIAEEIENPFGVDVNDLPLDEMCKNIKKSVETVL